MRLPVPNLNSPLTNKIGKLIPPWNSWFQQFSQEAPAVVDFSTTNPLTVNSIGTVIITGAATITLTRGATVINLTGQTIIPVSIGDTVSWTGGATVQFLGS